VISHCSDFTALSSGTATQGFANQTWNLGPAATGKADIHWRLENTGTYDAQANYSRVLYRQHVTNPGDDGYMPGRYADRRVTLYGGERCSELDPSDRDTLLTWFGFSCWSEDVGGCGTLPYGVVSFRVQPGPIPGGGEGWYVLELRGNGWYCAWGFGVLGGGGRISGCSSDSVVGFVK
jgi:hypothetical protein